jgi:hypothetical protein
MIANLIAAIFFILLACLGLMFTLPSKCNCPANKKAPYW